MVLDAAKPQRGGIRPNAGRKKLYNWQFLLSVQKEVNILRKKHPRMTIKKALYDLASRGKLPDINISSLARHIEKRRRLISTGKLSPEVNLLDKNFSFEAGIPAAIKDLP